MNTLNYFTGQASRVGNVSDSHIHKPVCQAGITGNIAVTLISSSSTQTVFNIKFNGVINQSGFTMTQNYDITYTYTKK